MKKHLLLLFAALLPLVASAEKVEIDGIWYNLTAETREAKVTNNGYRSYSGDITIPATITYEDVTYSVTSIGVYAFEDCRSLTSINIPESVTSIGDLAFRGCSSLTSITIPEGVTSIGEGAFAGCSSLTAIVVAEGNKVYDSRGGCNAIIETSTNTLLQGCSSTIIPESVTSIGNSAFFNCSSLTSITIPKSVTSIGNDAFYGCTSLTAINIPEGVTSIGGSAFWNCTSLTAITIPEGVTSIGGSAFYGCN